MNILYLQLNKCNSINYCRSKGDPNFVAITRRPYTKPSNLLQLENSRKNAVRYKMCVCHPVFFYTGLLLKEIFLLSEEKS